MVLADQFAIVFYHCIEFYVFLGETCYYFVFLIEFFLQLWYFLDIEIYLYFIDIQTPWTR